MKGCPSLTDTFSSTRFSRKTSKIFVENILTFGKFCGTMLVQQRKGNKLMRYVKHFYCSYCNKELLNQNEFIECDNENEFWCDDCDITFIIDEDGEVIEE